MWYSRKAWCRASAKANGGSTTAAPTNTLEPRGFESRSRTRERGSGRPARVFVSFVAVLTLHAICGHTRFPEFPAFPNHFLNRLRTRIDRSVGSFVELFAILQNALEIRHCFRIVRHRAHITLSHYSGHVLLRRRAQPDRVAVRQ